MQTLSEEIADADAVVIARLVKPALSLDLAPDDNAPYGTVDPETGAAEFLIEKILKGADELLGVERVEAVFFGEIDFEKHFLIRGIGDPLDWAVPVPLAPLAVDYVQKLPALPESGADRLAFFQPYLEHDVRQLAQDAYDEFARASYEDLIALKDRIDRPRILQLVEDPKLSPSRRRLFFTMLGVCGQPEDLPKLERLLESDARVLVPATEALVDLGVALGGPLGGKLSVDAVRAAERKRKLGLDALVACYLTLRGEEGLDLIDRRFLSDPNADQTHVYSTLMAIRFLRGETNIVPHERLLQSARLLLDNPVFADQVIPDLARWEDWSVADRLAQMFRDAGNGKVTKYVREPVVIYLDVASEQGGELAERTTQLLAELEPIDPEAFARARRLQAFGYLSNARASDDPSSDGDDALTADFGAEQADEVDGPAEMPPNPADFASEVQPTPTELVGTEPGETQPTVTDPLKTDPLNTDPLSTEPVNSEASDFPPNTAEPDVATSPAAAPADDTPLDDTQLDDTPSGDRAAPSRPVPAAAPALIPPSRFLLLTAPIAVAIGCFGLFWLILRSGGA